LGRRNQTNQYRKGEKASKRNGEKKKIKKITSRDRLEKGGERGPSSI